MSEDLTQAGGGQREQPHDGDGPEEPADLAGAEPLRGEQGRQDDSGDRDDDMAQAGRGDLEAFDGGQDTDRGRDDGVAVEQGDTDDAQDDQGPAGLVRSA